MKRAILVFGPESSGTRVVTKILVQGGCAGSGGHSQPWDTQAPDEDLIVWRRSFPHARKWPDIRIMLESLEDYSVSAVVVIREHNALMLSNAAKGHSADTRIAWFKGNMALVEIFKVLDEESMPFVVMTYEGLVQWPVETQKWLAVRLDLPKMPTVKIYDGNAKYYEGEEQ